MATKHLHRATLTREKRSKAKKFGPSKKSIDNIQDEDALQNDKVQELTSLNKKYDTITKRKARIYELEKMKLKHRRKIDLKNMRIAIIDKEIRSLKLCSIQTNSDDHKGVKKSQVASLESLPVNQKISHKEDNPTEEVSNSDKDNNDDE